jgi:carbamoylphosphate synthase small subunit
MRTQETHLPVRQQMCAQKAANYAYVCFKHRYVDVGIKIGVCRDYVNNSLKFTVVPHHSQSVKSINKC